MPQNNTVTIRPYHPHDYQGVVETLKDCGLYDELMDSEINYAHKIVASPDSVIVAWNGDKIMGCVVVVSEWGPLIFRLAVRKEFRKTGIGSALLDTAENFLRKKYHREAHLLVDENEGDLIKYYEKRGYQKGHVYQWLTKNL